MLSIVAIDNEIKEKIEPYFGLFESCMNNNEIRFIFYNRKATTIETAFSDDEGKNLYEIVDDCKEWKMLILSDDRGNETFNPFDNQNYPRANDLITICRKLGHNAPKITFIKAKDDYEVTVDEKGKLDNLETLIYPEQVLLVSLVMESKINTKSKNYDPNFWDRCGYPSNMRYMKYNILTNSNIETSFAYFEVMMLIHTLAYNMIGSNEAQAYTLYNLKIKINYEQLFEAYNDYYNKIVSMMNKLDQFHERIKSNKKHEYEKNAEYSIDVEIPLDYKNDTKINEISKKHYKMIKDLTGKDLEVLLSETKIVYDELLKATKMPLKTLKKATKLAKENGNYHDQKIEDLYLDEFQIQDVEEQLQAYEMKMITMQSEAMIQYEQCEKQLKTIEKEIVALIKQRVEYSVLIFASILIVIIAGIAFMPGILQVKSISKMIPLMMVIAIFVVIMIGVLFINLFLIQRKLKKQIGRFNYEVVKINSRLNAIRNNFKDYLSALSSYMKGTNLLFKTKNKDQKLDVLERHILLHKKYSESCLKRVTMWKSPLNRNFNDALIQESNVNFTLERNPEQCRYFHFNNGESIYSILINNDQIDAYSPFVFIEGIEIKKEEIL